MSISAIVVHEPRFCWVDASPWLLLDHTVLNGLPTSYVIIKENQRNKEKPMSNRLNFYDFLSYIIPGSLAVFLVLYFMGSILGTPGVLISYVSGFGETIVFLIVGYFAGHLIQARGRQIELRQKDEWGGYFSIQFLRESNDFYTADFRRTLKRNAESEFGLPVDIAGNGVIQEQKDKRYQEIFNLCYDFVVQKGVSRSTDIHNGIYGMFRGAIVVWEIGIFVALVAAVRHAAFLGYRFYSMGVSYHEPETTQLIIGIVLLVFFLGTKRFLKARFKHFGQRFVDSVFRNFLAYHSGGQGA